VGNAMRTLQKSGKKHWGEKIIWWDEALTLSMLGLGHLWWDKTIWMRFLVLLI